MIEVKWIKLFKYHDTDGNHKPTKLPQEIAEELENKLNDLCDSPNVKLVSVVPHAFNGTTFQWLVILERK